VKRHGPSVSGDHSYQTSAAPLALSDAFVVLNGRVAGPALSSVALAHSSFGAVVNGATSSWPVPVVVSTPESCSQ